MLTVLIPCRNELANIEECVKSARALRGEILVADCGSEDGTLQKVRAMPDCRLIQREFVNYADFKNWAIPQAGAPWVLILDADERIPEELAAEVRKLLAAPSPRHDAYWIGRRTFFLGGEVRYGPWRRDGAVRLFRRDQCRYRACRVHEGLDVARSRVGVLRHKMLHYTIHSYDQYFDKYSKYVRWGAEDLWAAGRRTNGRRLLLRPFFRFLWLYLVQGGFLDGELGVQTCILQAFFVTFGKQARLWEMEHGEVAQPATLPLVRSTLPGVATRHRPLGHMHRHSRAA